ncbi:MAG: ATP-grasp domain-containing protein [Clostridiales bacterium]|nr:ATP-grasp domain-containing protein [Clostridiales bacterium]
MATAVVTDGKYRTSIAAVRALGRAGYRVIVTQTRGDSALEPPVFSSRYVSESRWLDGAAAGPDYPDKLYELLRSYDHPVLFCAGAVTLNAVAKQRERFEQVCDFLIASPEALDALNDKETIHRRCEELGIPVPKQYDGEPEGWPVIIKPHCGEKFGLKAKDRYAIANNSEEYAAKRAAMAKYDPNPIVQQKVDGQGAGASLLLDRDGRLISAICHRRIREYPAAGGPSTCCESFYDAHMIDSAYRLLSSFGFVGMAMVEFKGAYVLEVNPRVWGSFPMTERAGSPFVSRYAQAAAGERLDYQPQDYQTGVRMRFTLNDGAAMLNYLRHGRPGPFFQGMADWFRAKDALSARDDPKPLRRYVRGMLLKR